VSAAYERAAALCENLGDDERLVPTLFGLASNRVVRGETRVALGLAERCRRVAERRGSPVDRLLAHRARGAALMQLGALPEARAEFERIGVLYDPERDRGLAARCVTDPRVSGRSFLAQLLWIVGYPEQARRTADEASRLAAELGHANTTGHVLCHAGGELTHFLRDVPATRGHAEAAMALAAEHDMPMWRGYGLILRGWAVAREGRPEEGASLVRQGVGELDALGDVFHGSLHLGMLAEIHARLGDPGAGSRALEEARGQVARTEVRLFEAELHRTEGELRVLAGRSEEAERCFAAALAVARRQGAKSFELRAAIALARSWRDQGRRAEAHRLLAPVHGWFSEGFDTPDLREANALLAELR
jgi:predicted ATPase